MAFYKLIFSLLLVPLLVISSYSNSFAEELKDNISLNEIKKKTNFELLSPQNVSKNWEVIVKPYPSADSHIITTVRLSYLDKSLKDYIVVGIEQTKEKHLSAKGKKVAINNNLGYFEAWADQEKEGGILRWLKNNTYLEMNSSNLTENEMIELAKSMK